LLAGILLGPEFRETTLTADMIWKGVLRALDKGVDK
jgi:hypothetical protein